MEDEEIEAMEAVVPSGVPHSFSATSEIELALIEPDRVPVSAGAAGPMIDAPVGAALLYIEENLDGRPNLEEAAAVAHISPSRLTHLFTEQVGIPFRSYILWARLKRMVTMVSEGDNLTQAAHGAGFSDSSHLTRVFRSNFGLAPSALLHMELTSDWPGA
jgi:AraC-like DNA-binding protein